MPPNIVVRTGEIPQKIRVGYFKARTPGDPMSLYKNALPPMVVMMREDLPLRDRFQVLGPVYLKPKPGKMVRSIKPFNNAGKDPHQVGKIQTI